MAQLASSKDYAARLEEEVARKVGRFSTLFACVVHRTVVCRVPSCAALRPLGCFVEAVLCEPLCSRADPSVSWPQAERIGYAEENDRKQEARVKELEEDAKVSAAEARQRDAWAVGEVERLREALHRSESERGRLEERLTASEERLVMLESRARAVEEDAGRLGEWKGHAEGALEGYRGAERALREEVESLSRRLTDERGAVLAALKDNRGLLVEVSSACFRRGHGMLK